MNFICKLSCRSANSKAQMKRNFRYLWSYPHYTNFCVTVLVLLKCLHVECCTCLQCQFSIFNLNFNVFHETWLVWQIVVLPGWKWRYIENICNINCNPLLHKQATNLRFNHHHHYFFQISFLRELWALAYFLHHIFY